MEETLVVAIWGQEKTCKTTMALTFPKPMYHFDLDVGGYNRAKGRFEGQDIVSEPYPTPLQLDRMMGKTSVSTKASRRIVGIKEVWQKFLIKYAEILQDKKLCTIVIDSGTQLWTICHQGFLQERQEGQKPDAPPRQTLKPIEYGEPNARMKSIIFAARSYKKNLVLTHYPRDVYAQKVTDKGIEDYKTGDVEIDGFKQTSALADVIVSTYLASVSVPNQKEKVVVPAAKVTLSGIALGMAGRGIEPTYSELINLYGECKKEVAKALANSKGGS